MAYSLQRHTATASSASFSSDNSSPASSNIIQQPRSWRQICLCGMLWRTLHEADALKHPSYWDEIILSLLSLSLSLASYLQQQVASSPDEFLHPW